MAVYDSETTTTVGKDWVLPEPRPEGKDMTRMAWAGGFGAIGAGIGAIIDKIRG